jgi:hypothetical protein
MKAFEFARMAWNTHRLLSELNQDHDFYLSSLNCLSGSLQNRHCSDRRMESVSTSGPVDLMTSCFEFLLFQLSHFGVPVIVSCLGCR